MNITPTGRMLLTAVGLIATLALAAFVYLPGLPGGFIFDDYSNLRMLENLNRLGGAGEFWRFVLEGMAGPLGRPVSLLSFALQHEAWPSDPGAFKAWNTAIHVTTGALVFILAAQLLRLTNAKSQACTLLALITAAIWLLHPMHVSTVLYIVQRMAQLAALFGFAAIIGYLKGRELVQEGRVVAGYLLTMASLVIAGGLSLLSKENGAVLPMLLAVLELTLLSTARAENGWRLFRFGAIYLPALLLPIAMLYGLNFDPVAAYATRDFSLGERLLSQARALLDYLGLILLPVPSELGIYHERFDVSRGLLQPWTTLPAVLILSSIIAAATSFRRRAPVLAFGALWFLGAHVVESTFIPLELYFLHRNYLAMVGPLFALVYYAYQLVIRTRRAHVKYVFLALGLFYSLLLVTITLGETRLWGDPVRLGAAWARENPESLRARNFEVTSLLERRHYPQAENALAAISRDFPDAVHHYLIWLQASCVTNEISLPSLEELERRAGRSAIDPTMLMALDRVVARIERGECAQIETNRMISLVKSLQENAQTNNQRYMEILLGRLRHHQGDITAALAHFQKANELGPSVDLAVMQVIWAAESGNIELARQKLGEAEAIAASEKLPNNVYLERFDQIRRFLSAEEKRQGLEKDETLHE